MTKKYFEKNGKLMTHDMWGNEEEADLSKLKKYDMWGNESSATIEEIALKDMWGNPYRIEIGKKTRRYHH